MCWAKRTPASATHQPRPPRHINDDLWCLCVSDPENDGLLSDRQDVRVPICTLVLMPICAQPCNQSSFRGNSALCLTHLLDPFA